MESTDSSDGKGRSGRLTAVLAGVCLLVDGGFDAQ